MFQTSTEILHWEKKRICQFIQMHAFNTQCSFSICGKEEIASQGSFMSGLKKPDSNKNYYYNNGQNGIVATFFALHLNYYYMNTFRKSISDWKHLFFYGKFPVHSSLYIVKIKITFTIYDVESFWSTWTIIYFSFPINIAGRKIQFQAKVRFFIGTSSIFSIWAKNGFRW